MSTLYISTDEGANWTTFATAGIVNAVLTLRSTGDDQILFSVDPATWTAAATWAAGAKLIFKQDSTVFFVGRLGPIPRSASGQVHRLDFVAYGPWARLEKITYGQDWTLRDSSTNLETTVTKPRVVLGQDPATGNPRNTGAEIAAIIDHAIAKGIPILKGTIDAGIPIPFDEQIMLRSADAIRSCLRWTPDYVCWWDYTTTASGVYKPTFNCRAASSLSVATVNLTSTTKPETAQISPLPDLQIPGIKITYEKTHTYNDNSYNSWELDSDGTPSDPEAVELLFELKGTTATVLSQDITIQALPADLNDQTFWRQHIPWLADIADGDLVITGAARDGTEDYPNVLIAGAIPEWLDGIGAEYEVFTANVAYVRKDGADTIEDTDTRAISVRLLCTDATTRTYTVLSDYDSGETTPSGVAAAIYASWSRLHYQGNLQIIQAAPDFVPVPGKVLRVTNGLAAWATMDAIVQEARIDFASGQTDFQFGPPGRLEADSLVALYRATRNRSFSWSRTQRASSALPGSETAGVANIPTDRPNDGDPGLKRRLVIRDTVSGDLQTLDFNPATVTFADAADKAAQTLQPREILVPELSGVNYVLKRRQVLCSASYHASVTLQAALSALYPFKFTQTSTTAGDVEAGLLFFNGVQTTITSLPSSLSAVTTTTRYYVQVDLSAGTAQWLSTAGAFPAGDATTEVIPILTLTCADSVISAIKQHRWSDLIVRYRAPATGGLDFSSARLGYSITGSTLTLRPGKLKFQGGSTSIDIAQATQALAGTQYAYVHHVRGSPTAAWAIAGAEPGVQEGVLDFVFYKFLNGAISETHRSAGDIDVALPLA